jgi:hypothetical protein
LRPSRTCLLLHEQHLLLLQCCQLLLQCCQLLLQCCQLLPQQQLPIPISYSIL